MVDSTPVTISEGDLRRLYAKINAHECLIKSLLRVMVASSEDAAKAFELFRSVAMEQADTLERQTEAPNAEFIDQGRVETVAFVAETFSWVKSERGGKAG
jgi:hypothetical protein